MNHQKALTSYIAAFVAELVISGVEHVVVSPGSRSTPLAMILAEHPDVHLHMHVDERSAAFFALGIAKASDCPVAILCTSGTAAANYYPAIIEAYSSRVPLIVLTADRPHELRDIGAPQAIDQIHLYGNHVKKFVEMAPPEHSGEMIRYARTNASRAVHLARDLPAGPVHLNFPFREPLIPHRDSGIFQQAERPLGYVKVQTGKLGLQQVEYENIAKHLTAFKRGIIVCGPLDEAGLSEAVTSLAKKLKFPILADSLSQLRSGPHDQSLIIDTYDTFLKNDEAKQLLKPEVIVRFGAMPISKSLSIFIKDQLDIEQWVIDGGKGWRDPSLTASEMIYCDEVEFCHGVSSYIQENSDHTHMKNWLEINEFTKKLLANVNDIEPISEGKLFYQLSNVIPDNATLFVGNSMPVRDLDAFFHQTNKPIKIMANRGANGIDGIISTALGIGVISQPLYVIVGDLTFFHDMNGLIASKLYDININLIIINNNGGGIFSFLPQAKQSNNFERLFGTPLHLDFESVIHMYGGTYTHVDNWEDFSTSPLWKREEKGLKVMEITTDRDTNYKEHRELSDFVSQEISRFLQGEY